jgi:DDE superfamily endonuclease
MAAVTVIRFCKSCDSVYGEGQKHCTACSDKPLLYIKCPALQWQGLYTNWYTFHRATCDMCNPERERKSDEERDHKKEERTKSLQNPFQGTPFPHPNTVTMMLVATTKSRTPCIGGCVGVVHPLMQLWLQHDVVLFHKTGQTKPELEFVWATVKHELIKHYEQHHKQRDPPLMPFDSLLATLYWLRVYPPTRSIAAELNVKLTPLRECIDHTLQSLFTTLVPACFSHSDPPSVAFRQGTLAGVCAVVDSTFLVLPHSSHKEERKLNYHYKSGTKQALKWQLCVTPDGVPWHLSDVVNGSVADITLLRDSELMDDIALAAFVLGDKGYIGESRLMTPHKKPRHGELKEEQKKANKERNKKRAVVENCIHQFKRWSILGGEYRGKWRDDDDLKKATRIVHVVGALVKRYLMAHPLRVVSGPGD